MKKGDIVIIHCDERSRGKWPLGIVEELYNGRDGIVRRLEYIRCMGGKNTFLSFLFYGHVIDTECYSFLSMTKLDISS